jgi:hypothetical protein
MKRMIRYTTALFCAILSMLPMAQASDLAIGANTIQKLIAEQLFIKQGRWYLLDDGPCYAYLESPHTRLQDGRLLLDAHLSSRIGVQVAGNCVGSGFASNVTMSGRLVGKGSTLTIEDIRIDHVDDEATRSVFDLVQNVAPQALPRALKFDVLSAVRGTPISAAGVAVSLSKFRIVDVTTQPGNVLVHFDLSLSTP